MDVREGDDALNAYAVLPCGLEGASHEDAGDVVEFAQCGGVVEDDGWVFAAEFDSHGC
jgi:hypothetical protein